MNKAVSIYVLRDPRNDAVRYVGATNDPARRLRAHKGEAKSRNSSATHKWVNSLVNEGLCPIMEIVDSGDTDTWEAKEKYWIQRYLDKGCDLTNSSNGGLKCKFTDETILKKSQLNKKAIIQYSIEGDFIREWDSATDAGRALSLNISNIASCCRGEGYHKRIGGFMWRIAHDPIPQPIKQPRLFQFEDEEKQS